MIPKRVPLMEYSISNPDRVRPDRTVISGHLWNLQAAIQATRSPPSISIWIWEERRRLGFLKCPWEATPAGWGRSRSDASVACPMPFPSLLILVSPWTLRPPRFSHFLVFQFRCIFCSRCQRGSLVVLLLPKLGSFHLDVFQILRWGL